MNVINPSYGYQMAQANAKAQGARLVSYTKTEDMAVSTITNDAKKPQTLEELQKELMAKYGVNQAGKTIEGIPASISVSPAFLQEALKNPEKNAMARGEFRGYAIPQYRNVCRNSHAGEL
ncbi:hypothetical protein [Helicobacter rodentium]|uniref:hypothetical protein n=1 Tax=Helicobacter rodentium TaxID=59617 RepID=UPI0023F580C1|nr:hypothetical protein [Helicobacter rodentium]